MMRFGLCVCAIAVWISAAPSFAEDASNAATPTVPTLQDTVRLTLVPELSLSVPTGWFTCDPAINQKLRSTEPSDQFKQTFCGPGFARDAVFKLVHPKSPDLTMALIFEGSMRWTSLLAHIAAKEGEVPRQDRQRDMDTLCGAIRDVGTLVGECEATVQVINGRPLFVGRMDAASADQNFRFKNKFVMIATTNHCYALLFVTRDAAQPDVGAIADAIIDSIQAS